MRQVHNPTDDVTSDGTNQYLYDADGRICAVANSPMPTVTFMTGYIYNAEGVRVAKGNITAWSCDPTANGFQDTNDYVLGPSNEQVTEMAMDANGSMAWVHTNVWANGALFATYDNDGLHFYLNDPLGTRRAQTDFSGSLEQTCSSLPFGDSLICNGANQNGQVYAGSLTAPTEQHFTGKERDAESGNDYFGARYYASSMGRFLSPDWSAKIMPVPYAKLEDPQSLNLYAYVRSNPLTRTDPTGHYNTTCSGNDISKCSSDIQNTEANRKANLLSKDPNVRNAATAMGTFNDGNNVNLKFDPKATVGKTTQDIGSNGKPTDSVTVTLPTAGTSLSDRGLLAHEGSHVEDFQNAMSGGQSLTKYQSEMKAYSTQAGVLLDAPFNEWGNTFHFSDNGASMILFEPNSSANRDINADSIRNFLGSDSLYRLTEQNQGGPEFVQP